MTAVQEKTCRVCGVSGSEAFYRNRGGSVCKGCTCESNRVCRNAHKDIYNATRRKQKEQRRATVMCQRCGEPAQRSRADAKYCLLCYRASELESKRAYAARHWPLILETNRERKRQIRAARPPGSCERCGAACSRLRFRRYCAPCSRALRRHRSLCHRAMKLGASGTHTKEQFMALCEATGWACVYCDGPLTEKTATEDHILALSKGGGNDIGNIAPACRSCNGGKGARTPEHFRQLRTAT